ncbi:FecR family protein [Puteibacter caeruleilacunae]|nr:FecR family protein [Puteibacter caeruleilacunae]
MTHKNKHIDDGRLASFLLGELDQEEQKQIIDWLDDSEGNRRYLDQLEQVWLETGKLDPRPISVNKYKGWQKLSNRIKYFEQGESRSRRNPATKRLLIYTSIAASALILIGIFSLLKVYKPEPQYIVDNNKPTVLHNTLPDGTVVSLNRNAQITYDTADDNQRTVKLQGEAYFKVKRDTLRPFIVNAGIGGVKVLGTSFNVKIRENNDIAVTVNSGKVELFYPEQNTNDTVRMILVHNEEALISLKQNNIVRLASNSSALFWLDKRLSFRNNSLKEVFSALETCYKVEIISENDLINNLSYSSAFIDKDFDYIIKVIAETLNFNYSKNGNTYTIEEADNEE